MIVFASLIAGPALFLSDDLQFDKNFVRDISSIVDLPVACRYCALFITTPQLSRNY